MNVLLVCWDKNVLLGVKKFVYGHSSLVFEQVRISDKIKMREGGEIYMIYQWIPKCSITCWNTFRMNTGDSSSSSEDESDSNDSDSESQSSEEDEKSDDNEEEEDDDDDDDEEDEEEEKAPATLKSSVNSSASDKEHDTSVSYPTLHCWM